MQPFSNQTTALITLFTLRCVVPLLVTAGFSTLLKKLAHRIP